MDMLQPQLVESESSVAPIVVPNVHNTPDAEANDFNRIEDKFFVRRAHLKELLEVLNTNLKPDYFYQDTKYNLIESNYFDSKDLSMIRNHFSSAPERFKIRVRKYAPNGVWNDDFALLEVKSKKEGVSRKYRFEIGPTEYRILRNDGYIPLSMELRKRNQKMDQDKLRKRVDKVNRKLYEYELRQQCSVVYKRLAFEKDGLRATIDTEIQHKLHAPIPKHVVAEIKGSAMWETMKQMHASFDAEDMVLLEVKHGGILPSWIEKFMQQNGTQKTSFSKYCYSMVDHLVRN